VIDSCTAQHLSRNVLKTFKGHSLDKVHYVGTLIFFLFLFFFYYQIWREPHLSLNVPRVSQAPTLLIIAFFCNICQYFTDVGILQRFERCDASQTTSRRYVTPTTRDIASSPRTRTHTLSFSAPFLFLPFSLARSSHAILKHANRDKSPVNARKPCIRNDTTNAAI